jgi:hypothetical protein
MRKLAFVLTFFFIGYILFVAVKPELFLEIVNSLTWPWLLGEEALRVAFGVALIRIAAASRMPIFLSIIGGFSVVAGIVFPILGVGFVRGYVDFFVGQNAELLSGMMVGKLAFMAVIVYALMPPREVTEEVTA